MEQAGADWIHIDVMDGHFVPNITIGPGVVRSIRKLTRIPFDCHLMISNPERYIEEFVNAGCDIITVHAEVSPHLHRLISFIKEKGIKAGVSLNPSTPLTTVESIITEIDLLLIMTVNPGFGGQKFIDTMLPKISRARNIINTYAPQVILEVDGGISQENIRAAYDAGADVFVAGFAVFSQKDYKSAIDELKQRCLTQLL